MALACAGISLVSPTLTSKGSLDINSFKKVTEINVYGSVYVAKYASIVMSKNKPVNDKGEKGVIIFVSSITAEEGLRGQVGYASTKGAINALVLPMARDLGKYGIRVAAVAPGIFNTPMTQIHSMPEAVKKRLISENAINREGAVEDFG